MEKKRRLSEGSPVAFTIEDKKSVKKVKLRINPVIMPRGFFLSPSIVPERTIGKTGRIHGERTVTIPARKAKPINKIILL